ncbi:hypothetical protein [Francisella tularensis]|uniref:hypothetical protein n=1 Tax=Francisella tularensis TaxID=263 RepID=UPI0016805865|nr:hypothetical protein [Francisella tularensis]MBD2809142.1 hypothetical protein [Francisella tularensis]
MGSEKGVTLPVYIKSKETLALFNTVLAPLCPGEVDSNIIGLSYQIIPAFSLDIHAKRILIAAV